MDKRTYKDRPAYLNAAVKKRRKKLKLMAVEAKGGKCIKCGYNRCIRALEFHHINPLTKKFSISTDGCTRSWAKIQIELEKTILVCANCHREIEDGLWQRGNANGC